MHFKNILLFIQENIKKVHIYEDEDILIKTVTPYLHIFDSSVTDNRVIGRCEYKLSNLLMIIFIATLLGAKNATEFHWVCIMRKELFIKLNLIENDMIPSHDTFRRILSIINPSEFEKALFSELESFFKRVEDNFDIKGNYKQISIDGKELRGSGRTGRLKNNQTLNIYNLSSGITMSRTIDNKTNEIPVAQEMLKLLNLNKTIITADALHTQSSTANLINEMKGHYVMNVKDNQKELKEDIIFRIENDKKVKVLQKNSKNYTYFELPDWYIGRSWPGQKTYIKYENRSKKTITTLYFISSLKSIDLISEAIENRWEIENGLHRYKDMLLEEDKIRYTNAILTTNLAVLNNFALSLIKINKVVLNIGCSTKFAWKQFSMSGGNQLFKILSLISSKEIINQMKAKIS